MNIEKGKNNKENILLPLKRKQAILSTHYGLCMNYEEKKNFSIVKEFIKRL
jgi:hypothetical protein